MSSAKWRPFHIGLIVLISLGRWSQLVETITTSVVTTFIIKHPNPFLRCEITKDWLQSQIDTFDIYTRLLFRSMVVI